MNGRVTGGDPDAEEQLFRQALDLRRELGDQAGVAASLFGVGLVRQVLRRDAAGAIPLFREALALAEEHGDDLTRSELHRHIGFYHLVHEQRPDLAVSHLRESLALRERHGDQRWVPSGLVALGQAELRAGLREEALGHLRAAVARSREARLRPERVAQAESALAAAADNPLGHNLRVTEHQLFRVDAPRERAVYSSATKMMPASPEATEMRVVAQAASRGSSNWSDRVEVRTFGAALPGRSAPGRQCTEPQDVADGIALCDSSFRPA